MNDKKNFLQNQQAFRNWGIAQLAQLASVMKRRTYTAGQVVKVQGDHVNEVVFVEHGSLDIARTIIVPNKRRKGIPTTKDATAAGSASIARSMVTKQLSYESVPQAGGIVEAPPVPDTVSIMVAQCGPGSIIGDTELVRGHETFLETAVVPEYTAMPVVVLSLKRKV
jgi:CRP-like cAMP-binding protein